MRDVLEFLGVFTLICNLLIFVSLDHAVMYFKRIRQLIKLPSYLFVEFYNKMKYVNKEWKRRERKRHKSITRKCPVALIDLINTIVSYALFVNGENVVGEVGWKRLSNLYRL